MSENIAESGEGTFVPAPLFGGDARPAHVETVHQEPAGRQEPTAPPEQAGEQGDSQQADGRARDPITGQFLPKPEVATGSPPAAHQEPPQHVPVAVHVAERKKLQARIAELEAQHARFQPQQQAVPQAPPAPPPPRIQPPTPDLMFSDPDRYHAGMVQYQHALVAAQRADTEQRQLARDSAIARRQWSDYDEVLRTLTQIAQANPIFGQAFDQELARSPDPAGHAYQRGKEILKQQSWATHIQQYDSPDAFIEAEVARRAQQYAPAASSHSVAPPPASLASARSVGPRGGSTAWTGPRPLFNSGRRA